jgi:NADH-quinone oxidoreductase subunit E
MSVRRLAEETVQPAAFAFSNDNQSWAERKMREYPEGRQQSAVIPLLMRAQEQEGWISRPAIEAIAQMLDMAYIRVLEVATFYTMFQLKPVGTNAHIQVCGTTPCMLRGAEDLRAVCQRRIHFEPHHLSEDGDFSWEEVECLGACVNAPMVQIFSDTYEDLTPETFERVLDGFAEGNPPSPGPQVNRIKSAPETGLTSLTDLDFRGPKAKMRPKNKEAPARTEPEGETEVTEAVKPASAVVKPELKPKPKPRSKAARPKSQPTPVADIAAENDARPKIYDAPPPQGIDDLKLISGVGPKLESLLHDLGIYRFDQIADWTAAHVAWVDERLKFKGRIERDDWISQAQILAAGG